MSGAPQPGPGTGGHAARLGCGSGLGTGAAGSTTLQLCLPVLLFSRQQAHPLAFDASKAGLLDGVAGMSWGETRLDDQVDRVGRQEALGTACGWGELMGGGTFPQSPEHWVGAALSSRDIWCEVLLGIWQRSQVAAGRGPPAQGGPCMALYAGGLLWAGHLQEGYSWRNGWGRVAVDSYLGPDRIESELGKLQSELKSRNPVGGKY